MAWLLGILEKFFLDWLWNKLSTAWSSFKKDKANEAKNDAQSNQDMKKAEELKPDSSKKEQEDAANDAFKHL